MELKVTSLEIKTKFWFPFAKTLASIEDKSILSALDLKSVMASIFTHGESLILLKTNVSMPSPNYQPQQSHAWHIYTGNEIAELKHQLDIVNLKAAELEKEVSSLKQIVTLFNSGKQTIEE